MSDISIVIPTRNRQKFLIQTVQEIFNISSNVEIIVMDNSDSPLVHDFDTNGNTYKYVYTEKLLSVVDNFENALQYPTRKYVAFIGDDDLISGNIEEIISVMESNKIDSIYPWSDGYISHFIWPGILGESGYLWVKEFDKSITLYSAQDSIDKAIQFPGKGPSNLPKIYQGIVSSDIIKKASKKFGHVFGGVSPDIYSGLLLADVSDTLASIDYPFVIPGASINSTAGEGVLKSDREANKSNREHISRFGDSLEWPGYIPDVYTPHTVWALSLCAAAETIGNKQYLKYLNFLYAEMFVKYPNYRSQILDSYSKKFHQSTNRVEQIFYGAYSLINYYFPRINSRLISKGKKSKKISFNHISEVQGHVKW